VISGNKTYKITLIGKILSGYNLTVGTLRYMYDNPRDIRAEEPWPFA
jgi:hypothetical protein